MRKCRPTVQVLAKHRFPGGGHIAVNFEKRGVVQSGDGLGGGAADDVFRAQGGMFWKAGLTWRNM